MLQFAVQSDASPLPVVGQQGKQFVDLLEGGARCHRVPAARQAGGNDDQVPEFYWWRTTLVL